jgi:hypothetical protein
MSASSRVTQLACALLFGAALAGAASAAPSASIEQVRNGQATATTTPTPSWGTGNAGASNSHYLESHSTAYRSILTGLPTDGTVVELTIGYDVKRSGSYALDYLTHYQRLLPHVTFSHRNPEVINPLDGVSGVAAGITTAPIPLPTQNLVIDPDGAASDPAAAQPMTSMGALPDSERVMTLFGGQLLDVTYVSEANVLLVSKSSETQVKVRFIPNGPTAVLAWGGHIASRWDWGFNTDGTPRSAGGISGSSYHMRLIGWNLGSLGSMDRSMSTDAVYPVPRCMISPQGPFCAGTIQTHTAPSGMESYSWSLADNTAGAFFVGGSMGTSVTVQTTQGGSYTIALTTGASGFTKTCQALVTVNAPIVVSAGPDAFACATSPALQLQGTYAGGNPSWTGGAGTFSPGRTDPNATYTPTAGEVAAGGVTLTLVVTPVAGPCPPANDPVRITYQPAASANAGIDQTVCASNALVQLAGAVSGSASSGTWTGGAGTFTPSASALNATYLPSAGEIAAGGVTLTLTSNDPAGPCDAFADQVRITIAPGATADAGADQPVCANAPAVVLAGVIGGGGTTGTWTGGAGSYNPRNTALNATYTPTAGEIAAGGVTLTLTSNDPAGPCGPATDTVRITIQPAATANAGIDQLVCASSPLVQLAGVVGGGASSGTWSGGAGTFTPNANALNATYLPSAGEIAAGGVTLTLTSNDPAGPCGTFADQVRITINAAAIAIAGADQVVCANSPAVQLAGSISGGATGGVWSGGAGSFSPKNTTLNATYMPTAGEIAAGGVTLTLTANDPAGPCPAVSATMHVTIDPITRVDAGADQPVCASNPRVQLQGSVQGAVSGGNWTGGTGTFSPGRNVLNPSYTPSPAEIAAGTVTLTLTSASAGRPCPPASDQVTITIYPVATIQAGADPITCATSPQVQLSGTIGGSATGGTWSGGGGTFTPGPNVPNPIYTPTLGEIASRSVTLTYTTNDPAGPCGPVSDQVRITYDQPTVSVTNQVVCQGVPGRLCASAGNGVAPYVYRWSNGQTTQCIAVSDTGRYTVTVTDAKGCQATASGAFRWRDCVGALYHTSTTCATFQDGTAEELLSTDVHFDVRDGKISTISPGVFFYFSKITAPRADFTIVIEQARSNPTMPFCELQQSQVTIFDGGCQNIGDGVETSPGQASIAIHGATPGQVLIVSVKYSLKNLVGVPFDPAMGVRYDFRTLIDGQIVDFDRDGLLLGLPLVTGVGDDPVGDGGSPELYRPVPNPFTNNTRIAYAVARPDEVVDIRVYDLAGRLVRVLAKGTQTPGLHYAIWDGRDEQGASIRKGLYFVRARVGGQVKGAQVTLLK